MEVKCLVTCSAAALLCVVAAERPAAATPRPLPFTYTTETLSAGSFELEEYTDLTPVVATNPSGNPASYLSTQFQVELEYGITDRLELGLYVVDVPTPPNYTFLPQTTETTGAKERLRYTFADPGEWPIDVGVYGELVEGTTEMEFEGKILLQRRFDRLRLDTNLWAEYELYYGPTIQHGLPNVVQRDVVLNPTLGATYEITPAVQVGAESWMRVEYPNPAPHPRPFALGPAVYLGPTILLNFGKLWWSTGIYGRTTRVEHVMQLGDPFGPVWARLVVGIEL